MAEIASHSSNSDLWYRANIAAENKDFRGLLDAWEALSKRGENSIFCGIGEIYERGATGVARDSRKAFAAYLNGINATDDSGCHAGLGRCYFLGNGHDRDWELARKHFQAAAAAGNSVGYLYLGRMHFLGAGVPRNYKLAEYYLKPAMEEGFVSAYILLSKIWWRQGRIFSSFLLHIKGLRLGVKISRSNPADIRLL